MVRITKMNCNNYIVSVWKNGKFHEYEESNLKKAKEMADEWKGEVYVLESARKIYDSKLKVSVK